MRYKQSGFALITSLIILIALSILVLGGTQATLMQEKMTAAVRNSHIALEIAESGTMDAEAMIEGLSDIDAFNDSGAGGKYSLGNGPADYFDESIWSDTKSMDASTTINGQQAQYYVEYMGTILVTAENDSIAIGDYDLTTQTSNVHTFKIVSRSLGIDGNSERIVVSYYGKTL